MAFILHTILKSRTGNPALVPVISVSKWKYQTYQNQGRDKRANIAALRQAKIYPPRQAAAAAMWIAAATIHEMDYFGQKQFLVIVV